jgi:hypothetical protein
LTIRFRYNLLFSLKTTHNILFVHEKDENSKSIQRFKFSWSPLEALPHSHFCVSCLSFDYFF